MIRIKIIFLTAYPCPGVTYSCIIKLLTPVPVKSLQMISARRE